LKRDGDKSAEDASFATKYKNPPLTFFSNAGSQSVCGQMRRIGLSSMMLVQIFGILEVPSKRDGLRISTNIGKERWPWLCLHC
jgi:hypothetical protein